MSPDHFVKEYAEALRTQSAGLFVGAGVSMGAGYPSWKKLVAEMATEIKFDVDRETDLAGVVQYFLNKNTQARTRLTKTILTEIGRENKIPASLQILARLPLKTIWTTNYDTLIERAWKEQRLKMDVKSAQNHLQFDMPHTHATLYKMHGCVTDPTSVVLAKSDYETYRRFRGEFLNVLHSNLVSKRFLFLGFSFTDPNLSYLFMLIREAFDKNPPEHYAIVRTPQESDYGREDAEKSKFEYDSNAHEHWMTDLKNYGIQCVSVSEFGEIPPLLEKVERRLVVNSVFVSGCFDPDADAAERRRIEDLAFKLGSLIAGQEKRLVSGFGRVVGSAVVSGAIEKLYDDETPNLDERMYLRPFPTNIADENYRREIYTRYREDIIRRAGVCVFLSGTLFNDRRELESANGVIEEYEIARAQKRLIIPIGARGGAASEIWNRVSGDFDTLFPGLKREAFDSLNDASSNDDELMDAVSVILKWHGDRIF